MTREGERKNNHREKQGSESIMSEATTMRERQGKILGQVMKQRGMGDEGRGEEDERGMRDITWGGRVSN